MLPGGSSLQSQPAGLNQDRLVADPLPRFLQHAAIVVEISQLALPPFCRPDLPSPACQGQATAQALSPTATTLYGVVLPQVLIASFPAEVVSSAFETAKAECEIAGYFITLLEPSQVAAGCPPTDVALLLGPDQGGVLEGPVAAIPRRICFRIQIPGWIAIPRTVMRQGFLEAKIEMSERLKELPVVLEEAASTLHPTAASGRRLIHRPLRCSL